MKQIRFFLMALAALCFTAVAQAQDTKTKTRTKTVQQADTTAYQCPMKCEGGKTYAKAGKCPVCHMNLKEVKSASMAYQCPMKCEGDKTYTQTGKCPVCNMSLKEVKTKEKKKEDQTGHSHS